MTVFYANVAKNWVMRKVGAKKRGGLRQLETGPDGKEAGRTAGGEAIGGWPSGICEPPDYGRSDRY